MRREPLLTTATVVGIVGALLGLLAAFGVNLSEGQREAVLEFAAVLLPPLSALVAAAVARRKVTPVADPRDGNGRPMAAASTRW